MVFWSDVISILATVNTTDTYGHFTDVSKDIFALLSSAYILYVIYVGIWFNRRLAL